jgi:glutathione S-transferase
VIDDPQAILIHLARTYDRTGRWYPDSSPAVARWLAFSSDLAATAGAARVHDAMLAHEIDVQTCRERAHVLMRALDDHLWFNEQQGMPWLCSPEHPTIADIACFPDVMLAEEGNVMLHEYAAIRRWTDRAIILLV